MIAPLEARIDIAAAPERVWPVVSDLKALTRRSPETLAQLFLGPVRRGALSLNLNRRKAVVWPTASRIVSFEPPRLVQFYVYGPGTMWTYSLAPHDGGTRLTERRTMPKGRRTLLSRLVAGSLLGGVESHDAELLDGMHRTLQQIKAAAEAAA